MDELHQTNERATHDLNVRIVIKQFFLTPIIKFSAVYELVNIM